MTPPDSLLATRALTASAITAGNSAVAAYFLASADTTLTELEKQISAARLALEKAQTDAITRWHSKGART